MADNWMKGPGIPYDRWEIPPDSRHHLYFGLGNSSACHIPASMAPALPPPPTDGSPHLPRKTFAGIHSAADYEGVVYLEPAHMGVDQFHMGGGSVSQAGTTLTVLGQFTWTGGTINNSSTAGQLKIAPGVSGVAEPVNAGTVNLGSTLTLLGNEATQTGGELDVRKGSYNVLRGDGFVVQKRAQINFQAQPGLTGKIKLDGENKPNPSPLLNVERGGTAEFYSINREAMDTSLALVEIKATNDDENAYVRNAGTTTIRGLTELRLVSKQDTFGYYVQDQLDPLGEPDAYTRLEAGIMIACTGPGQGSVEIRKGRFEVKTRVDSEG